MSSNGSEIKWVSFLYSRNVNGHEHISVEKKLSVKEVLEKVEAQD